MTTVDMCTIMFEGPCPDVTPEVFFSTIGYPQTPFGTPSAAVPEPGGLFLMAAGFTLVYLMLGRGMRRS